MMTTPEIYNLANEMTEQEVLNVIGQWERDNETKSIETYNNLVKLGDSMQLACASVIADKINRPWMFDGSADSFYRYAYES
tara:strand:- start:337 stop:579 length:243 start_codon:yes stop_codon:yes gene_type:complete